MTLLDDTTSTMLSSDSASSSSPPPSPHIHRNRLRRKRSPSPPSRHHYSANPFPNHPRPYSPSSPESDIARLLHPTYASPIPRPITQVYVDNHGDLHDPDFRHFPLFRHTHTHMQPHRHRWDAGYPHDDDEDDEDDEVEQKRLALVAQRRRPSSTAYYTTAPYYTYDEPSSYDSQDLAELDELSENHERVLLKDRYLCPRSNSPEKRHPIQNEKVDASTGQDAGDSEWTPTCSESLRRQWQAIALSFRFSLFRTKRRIQRRMSR